MSGSISSNSNGGGGGEGGFCGACTYLRRKCVPDCIFAPYFNSEQGIVDFAIVEKVFDLSYVTRLLNEIPDHQNRLKAVESIIYEAQVHIDDPIYGCWGRILKLEKELQSLKERIQNSKKVKQDLEKQIQNLQK
ncbi:Prefoldin domain-containing protein [Dioscorea alata]|uniref:Prefoldin domain-containing protein n=1 Tax=Dioscorea alata TaxID=55571 RepID=A0ACB7U5H6_DIOAL|nr:Prefoldin domain-containing protein [Dioscorea alata]